MTATPPQRPVDIDDPDTPKVPRHRLAVVCVLTVAAATIDWSTAAVLPNGVRALFVLPALLLATNLRKRQVSYGVVLVSIVAGVLAGPDGWSRLVLLGLIAEFAYRWRAARDEIRFVGERDQLTGLLNNRGFRRRVEEESQRLDRGGRPFTLLLLDVSRFKELNDRLGHVVGDRCLRVIAATLDESTRRYDAVGRLGGDEFVILAPDTDELAAVGARERLRTALREAMQSAGWDVDVDLGSATFDSPPASVDAALDAADRAMYEEKRAARVAESQP